MGSTRSHRVLPAATASTEKYEWRKYESTHYNEAGWAVSQASTVKRVWPYSIQIFSHSIRFVWLYFANILKILSSIMKEITRRPVLTQTISRFCVKPKHFSSTLSLAVILSQGEKLAAMSSQWYRFILADRALKKQKTKKKLSEAFHQIARFCWRKREAGGVWRIERVASTSFNPFLLIGSGSTPFYNEPRPPYFFWLRLFCALVCSCLRVLYLYRDKSLLEHFNATLRPTNSRRRRASWGLACD